MEGVLLKGVPFKGVPLGGVVLGGVLLGGVLLESVVFDLFMDEGRLLRSIVITGQFVQVAWSSAHSSCVGRWTARPELR